MKIKWNPEGFSEPELFDLVKPPGKGGKLHPEFGIPLGTSWVAEVYGAGKLFREYGWYPRFLPLFIQVSHSIAMYDEPAHLDLVHPFRDMFYFSERMVAAWKERTNRPVSLIESPYSFYCRTRKIEKKSTATGTLVFPAHETHWVKGHTNYEELVGLLKSLAPEFQPVGVCMYWLDIESNKHRIFIDNGFPVYTAGHWANEHFVDNFYEILRNYKYALSNMIGSYTYYAISLGLPFSVIGSIGEIVNLGDEGMAKRKTSDRRQWKHYSALLAEVEGLRTEISPVAAELVRAEMGVPSIWHRLRFSLKLYKGLLWGIWLLIRKGARLLRAYFSRLKA